MLKGRWSSDKSCRHYLNAGKALLVSTALPSRSARPLQVTRRAGVRQQWRRGLSGPALVFRSTH